MTSQKKTPWKKMLLLFALLILLVIGTSPVSAVATGSDSSDLVLIQGAEANMDLWVAEPDLVRGVTARVPILIYHSLNEEADGSNDMEISPSVFQAQIDTLYNEGYQTVLFSDLYDFVENGTPLPARCVVLAFDDGYLDNLTLAAPVLADYGFCAEVNVIGCSVGKSTYKNTGEPIIPHFSLEAAEPWIQSGVIHLSSHTYDMHQVAKLDGDSCRKGVLPLSSESEESYRYSMLNDFYINKSLLDQSGCPDGSLSLMYPYGAYNDLTEQTLKALGVAITVTAHQGVAEIAYRDRDSLRLLPRLLMTNNVTPQRMMKMIMN